MLGHPEPRAPSLNEPTLHQSRDGLLLGLGAYGLWGVIPLYFRLLTHLPPWEVLAHRVVWAFSLLAVVIVMRRRVPDIVRIFRSRQVLARLAASTLLIGLNWFTFIYAVFTSQVVEASLGYFITPLVNVLLGVVCLGERLRTLQCVSLMMAAAGVLNLALLGHGIPWIALTLACSFAVYGLIRKTVAADSMSGLFVETMLLSPPALLFLAVLQVRGTAVSIPAGLPTLGLLALSGMITTVPLLLFAAAARRLTMATLGFLQYLAPSIQFLLAIFLFGEPFTSIQLASFACIWTAVALYSTSSYLAYRQLPRRRDDPAATSATEPAPIRPESA
jgi:chloramphenicol-sensitive protein RarD